MKMTVDEAIGHTNLMRELEQELRKAKDEETRAIYEGWIKNIEPLYAQAQKVLERRESK